MAMRNLFSNVPSSLGRRFGRSFRRFFSPASSTIFAAVLMLLFLSPFLYMTFTALKTKEQMNRAGSPLWPADPATYNYKGVEYYLYEVPADQGVKELALYKKGLTESYFIDPSDPDKGPIKWQGSWRSLRQASWKFAPHWENFKISWDQINFPRLFLNTLFYTVTTEIGVLLSCTLVAYGFARFRIPGKDLLFTILLATIFLPSTVTIIPTYTFFSKIGWVGTYLPLIIPSFFANAYDVFFLRQFMLAIPRDLDEAAMIDGAGPLRILFSIILPQMMPAVIALSIFHIIWAWNDYFGPLIYLTNKPELQPISVGLTRFNSLHTTNPNLTQAASLMALLVPLILYIFAQRYFIRGIVFTGVEK